MESLKKQLSQPEIGFPGYKQIQSWLGTQLGVEAEGSNRRSLSTLSAQSQVESATTSQW